MQTCQKFRRSFAGMSQHILILPGLLLQFAVSAMKSSTRIDASSIRPASAKTSVDMQILNICCRANARKFALMLPGIGCPEILIVHHNLREGVNRPRCSTQMDTLSRAQIVEKRHVLCENSFVNLAFRVLQKDRRVTGKQCQVTLQVNSIVIPAETSRQVSLLTTNKTQNVTSAAQDKWLEQVFCYPLT